MKKHLLATAIGLALASGAQAMPPGKSALSLKVVGQYQTGKFDESAAEVVAHDARNQRIFVINAAEATVDVLDINDPANPTRMGQIAVSGAGVNSVAVYKDLVAVAVEAKSKQAPGSVAFYDATSLVLLKTVTAGALPDMVTFTPNGQFVLVANEGEPNDDYTIDPEGSVSVIDLRGGVMQATVATADFRAYNGKEKEDELRAQGVRIFGPGASAAQDFEPEYIAVSRNSQTAWVAMQENNALAVVDIKTATVTDILPLGTKDHTLPGNEFDASNRDHKINITSWPTKGMYMPDSIASYSFRGQTYIVTANEGDARDYDGWTEEFRMGDLTLTGDLADIDKLQDNDNLGRLRTTSTMGISNDCDPSRLPADLGDLNEDGKVDVDDVEFYVENICEYDTLYSYGARSFSIWSGSGELVYDSGADFENNTADEIPDDFNSNNDENGSFDSRSDDKGPEPEGIALGTIGSRTIAFVGLERVGGIMAYDISNPRDVQFLDYINNRDFSVDAEIDGKTNPLVGDLGPEGLVFIKASKSPSGKPMLVVGNEVSGTTTFFEVAVEVPGKGKKR